MERRDVIRLAAGIAAAAAASPAAAQMTEPVQSPPTPRYPFGTPPPFSGLTLPPYYKPTPSVKSRSNYVPGTEELGADEMRITFLGSTPWPPQRDQAGTCIMVELGNGKQLFFDFGNGCIRNYFALGKPLQIVNDIFLTHLHVDHYADLPYLLPFRAFNATFVPLRVYGPSGRTPELGTRAMIDNMKRMLRWHLESFDAAPIGDGYEVEVAEFDFRDDNGICYDKDGVVVRHWRRSHSKDGASAYRLDWNGLSFVWTGDGRPDENTVRYARGCDVFVTEAALDVIALGVIKFGLPPTLAAYTMDTAHTPTYAAGYMMKEINPRLGQITHMDFDDVSMMEAMAQIRTHYDGLFVFGGPDVLVTNVTRDAIWCRRALLATHTGTGMPTPQQFAQVYGLDMHNLPAEFTIPQPRLPRPQQLEASMIAAEIDPRRYYPAAINRPLVTSLPPNMRVNLSAMMGGAQPPERR